MYGTIARLQLKPGAEEQIKKLVRVFEEAKVPGFVTEYVYRMNTNPNEYYMVVVFESKEAYEGNANSPAQHQRYEQYRELLAQEPEWHDGNIAYHFSAK